MRYLLITYASMRTGSEEPTHPLGLARDLAARDEDDGLPVCQNLGL